mgnify:CR=1 FL=1
MQEGPRARTRSTPSPHGRARRDGVHHVVRVRGHLALRAREHHVHRAPSCDARDDGTHDHSVGRNDRVRGASGCAGCCADANVGTSGSPFPIVAAVAVGSARRSDLVVSGSSDGVVRLWTVGARDDAQQSLDARGAIPQLGFVNGLALPSSGAFVAAAVGKEPRLGRWEKVSKAPNAVVLLPLSSGSS